MLTYYPLPVDHRTGNTNGTSGAEPPTHSPTGLNNCKKYIYLHANHASEAYELQIHLYAINNYYTAKINHEH